MRLREEIPARHVRERGAGAFFSGAGEGAGDGAYTLERGPGRTGEGFSERADWAVRRRARRRRLRRPVLDFDSGSGAGEGAEGGAVEETAAERGREEASSSAEMERTTLEEEVIAEVWEGGERGGRGGGE